DATAGGGSVGGGHRTQRREILDVESQLHSGGASVSAANRGRNDRPAVCDSRGLLLRQRCWTAERKSAAGLSAARLAGTSNCRSRGRLRRRPGTRTDGGTGDRRNLSARLLANADWRRRAS